MTLLLKAEPVVESITTKLAQHIKKLPLPPKLTIIMVGNDQPSKIYTSAKQKACKSMGIDCSILKLPSDTSLPELHTTLTELNQDPSIDGILLQLPLPAHLPTTQLLNTLSSHKDVDGLNSINQGLLWNRTPKFIPCTPKGILSLLDYYSIELTGKNVVILGESKLVGRPLAALLLNRQATVTLCHSKTRNIQEHVRGCDILVSATGVRRVIPSAWIPDHCSVIDVGIHSNHGKIVGDLDHSTLTQRVHALTPVPGGVGPMTVISLVENTLLSAELKQRSST
ncbi:MAG TPA: bifunctional 5,10-methylenetetrahydrofolate dehydrogenase/5,10-methenyltetrahydrofolate cyclohydrolase [Gammaproteobacteria bacterium]|nr:bifunctional 5,10-methylenetetrahydrofolate dehydrogenase/5,10-methenyltetrahydrofolate cyclohydrolase [Gammaproteobacteria bacterium]